MGRKKRIVGSPTSTTDKTNLQYICECKPHLTSQFCRVEISLKFTSYHDIRAMSLSLS